MTSASPRRPAFRWADIHRAPLHDFPLRDEILYQYMPLSPGLELLEVGPGSGFTAYRLSRAVRGLTVVDVAAEVVADLEDALKSCPNVRLVCADVTKPDFAERVAGDFDGAYALDVFEYLVDPGTALRNLASVLRPDGHLLLSYPNVPPPAGDGVTWFSDLAELEELVAEAGFAEWEIFAVRLRPWAGGVYRALHEWPLAAYRRVRAGSRDARPQTYDATWAFRHRGRLVRYRAPLHLAWRGLELVMRGGGDMLAREPASDGILGRQLVIRARR